ncbi:hypothetical protein V865_001609 [Kwoniella europaea PYCC6329]|uniref:Major facilitator superfamily (MFS) profile domain-containing protein n=1 Tax=Kwoniella europaea PYCC6329 TaxID=1423913 RepID=A0AAX4KB11_9TREE
MDSLTYGLIFPFIVEYITSLDVPQDKIGLYAGISEGSLMLAEAAAAPFWAKAADKYGRKRCATLGFLVSVLASGCVGFGQSVGWIIFWRMCVGLNPTPVLSKILITELTHPSNRGFIFSIYSPIFNTGYLLGHLIGGWLANPYGRLPSWMGGDSAFFKRWPYALPCLVNAFLGLISVITGCLFLDETQSPLLESNRNVNEAIELGDASDLHGDDASPTRSSSSRELWRQTLRIPHFVLVLASFCAVYAFEGLFTVFTYTSIEQGGLGFPVETIGSIIAFTTLLYIIGSPIIIPRLKSRYGVRKALTITVITIPIEALLIPFAQFMARLGRGWTWLVFILVQSPLKNFHQMGWPMNDHLNTACFDDYPKLIATGSAITLIAGASGRAFGPTFAGWLFSISTEYPLLSLGRQISWISLFLMTLPPVILSLYIPEGLTKENLQDESLENEDENLPLV